VFFAIFQANELAGQDNVEAKPRLTISRETTFFTEPIRADGSIDFVAAINNEFGKGVKPEENACTYLHRAFGPIKELPPSFYAELGIERPPAEGQYLQPFPLPRAIAELPAERLEKVLDHAEAAVARPWTRQECPELGAWLDAHREPLELVHAAARCQKFYSPLSDEFINVEPTKGGPLLAVLLPGASKMRMAGRMLCSRAMLQLGEGDAEGAWADLIACRRLGRLASVGPTLVETLVGHSIENMSSRGILTLLEQTRPSSATVKQYRNDLKKLPPIVSVRGIVNVSERCTYIDAMLTIAWGQPDAMELLGVEAEVGEAAQMFRRVNIRPFDWDEALKTGNAYYDRLVNAMQLPTHAERRAAMQKLNVDLKKQATLRDFVPHGKRDIESARAFASVMAALMLPSLARVREGEDVLRQTATNIDVALALRGFCNDQHRYPEQLEELVPKYLAKMPVDQFTGGSPIYRQTGAGYLLYSVGPNTRDDGGRTDGKADDLAVTVDSTNDEPEP
jgi:hypothetical protein